MGWFDGHGYEHRTKQQREVYGFYEKVYTVVDAIAAVCFVIGSALFFYKSLQEAATWLFLIGSIFFLVRPGVRVLREFHLAYLPLPGDKS